MADDEQRGFAYRVRIGQYVAAYCDAKSKGDGDMKTRVVLMLNELEFACLAGEASGARLTLQEFIKRELGLLKKGDKK